MKKGIGLSIFEFRGKTKKKLFEYRSTPDNMERAIDTINSKMGMEIKKHSEKISRSMRY
jgi:hypothetical protein